MIFLQPIIIRYRNVFFLISLCSTIAWAVIVMKPGQKCLRTAASPHGIVSLELSWNDSVSKRIFNVWSAQTCPAPSILLKSRESTPEQQPLIEIARTNTKYDFVFIILYTFLLIIAVIVTEGPLSNKRWQTTLLAGVAAASLLDVIENSCMLYFMQNARGPVWTYSLPASIKFFLLFIVVCVVLRRRIKFLSDGVMGVLKFIIINRVIITMLLAMYVLLGTDQGQDLLLNLNDSILGPAFFCVVISMIAVLNWHFPKYFLEANPKLVRSNKGGVPGLPAARSFRDYFRDMWSYNDDILNRVDYKLKKTQRAVGRFLGVLTFLIPMNAILHALEVFEVIPALNTNLIFLSVAGLSWAAIKGRWLERSIGRSKRVAQMWLYLQFTFIALVCSFAAFNDCSPQSLPFLAIDLLFLAFAFLIWVTLRGAAITKLFRTREILNINRWALVSAIVGSVIFILINIFPLCVIHWAWMQYFAMSIVLTAAIFYTTLFTLLIVAGRIWKWNVSLFVFAFAAAFAIYWNNSFHDLHKINRKDYSGPDSLKTYIRNWLSDRQEKYSSDTTGKKSYPVFIINTYGGGIRATAWTCIVVNKLDSIVYAATAGKETFQDHVLCYSGASGGTIGASILCANRSMEDTFPSINSNTLHQVLHKDYLTPVVAAMFGSDVLFSFLGISHCDDRARIQERVWQYNLSEVTGNGIYGSEFNSIWYVNDTPRYDVPLLFSNTTQIQEGVKGIMAPVLLDPRDFPVADLLNNILNERDKKRGLPFSTAAFLSARFPYISPAGKLDATHHYLDGGFRENSGAETAMQVYSVLQKELTDTTTISKGKSFSVYFITLQNHVRGEQEDTSGNVFEMTAPFLALLTAWEGNTKQADSTMSLQFSKQHFVFQPDIKHIHLENDSVLPVLPLGWQISNYALRRLEQNFEGSRNKNLILADSIAALILH